MRSILFAVAVILLGSRESSGQRAIANRADSATATARKLMFARKLVRLTGVVGTTAIESHPIPTGLITKQSSFMRQSERAAALWSQKYLPADSIAEINARAFVGEFSEEELRGLLAFYDSPLGRRFVDAQPRLLQTATAETSRILGPHRPELREALRKIASHIDSI